MKNEEVEVVVVSLDNYSFEILKSKKFYAFPKGSRRIGEYFAFYHDKKIEYYGKVSKSLEVSKEEVGIGYWLRCLPQAEPPFQKVIFKKLIKLKKPLLQEPKRGGKGHIQGKVYTTLKKLLEAETISQLS